MSLHCSSRGPCGAPRAGAESSLLLCLRCHLGCCDPLFQFVLDFRAFPAVSSVIVHGEAGILGHRWRECKMVRLPWESWQFPQNRKQRRDLAVPFRAHAREEVKQGCEQTSARHPCRPRKGRARAPSGPNREGAGRRAAACAATSCRVRRARHERTHAARVHRHQVRRAARVLRHERRGSCGGEAWRAVGGGGGSGKVPEAAVLMPLGCVFKSRQNGKFCVLFVSTTI